MLEKDKERLIQIIVAYLPQTRIFLFGSRARKDNTPQSDIDIAIDNGDKVDSFVLSTIKEEIEESTIPFTVDVVDLRTVSNDFKDQVLREGVIWKP